jgi:hypothetical protein
LPTRASATRKTVYSTTSITSSSKSGCDRGPCQLLAFFLTEQRAQVIEALGFAFNTDDFQTMLTQKRILEDKKGRHLGRKDSKLSKTTLDDVIHASGDSAGLKSDTAFKLLERQRGVDVEISPEDMMLYFQNWYIGMTTWMDHWSLLFWVATFTGYIYLEFYHKQGHAILELFFANHHDNEPRTPGMQMREPTKVIVTEPEL